MQSVAYQAPPFSLLSPLSWAARSEYPGLGMTLRPQIEALATAATHRAGLPAEAERGLLLPICTAIVQSVVEQHPIELCALGRGPQMRVVDALVSHAHPWQAWLPGLLGTARDLLSLSDYAVFELRAYEVARVQGCHEAAFLLEPMIEAVAEGVVGDFRARFETAGDGAELRPLLENFLAMLSKGWSTLNDLEMRFNVCAWWARQCIPRFEATRQQWQFLFATLERNVYVLVGATPGRLLSRLLDPLQAALPRFELTAAIYRNLDRLAPADPTLLDGVVAEVLLSAAEPRSVMAAALWLGAAAETDVAAFASTLLEACRPLCERAWLDWMDDVLERMKSAAQWRQERLRAAAEVDRVVRAAATNLREALGIFDNSETLEQNLAHYIDGAGCTAAVFPTWTEAACRYRAWLVQTFVLREGTAVWQHGRTIARALRTSLGHHGRSGVWSDALLALIDSMADVTQDTLALVEAWPGLAQADLASRPFTDRIALDAVRFGGAAARQTLAAWSSGAADEQAIARAAQVAGSLRTAFDRIQRGLPSAQLSTALWVHSDEIGQAVSADVYEELPDYAARTQAGEGPARCARDVAITLRRVARAYEPAIEDADDFVATWWSGLVDAYVVTRPSKLFTVTLRAILDRCGQHVPASQVAMVDRVLRPLYESAATDPAQGAERPSTDASLLALVDGPGRPADEAALAALAHLVETTISEAVLYGGSQQDDRAGAIRLLGQQARIKACLLGGFEAYSRLGLLSLRTCRAWVDLIDDAPALANAIEKTLLGIIQHADLASLGLDRLLPSIDYLQASAEFVRQATAGTDLRACAPALAPPLKAPLMRVADALRAFPPILARVEVTRIALVESGVDWDEALEIGETHFSGSTRGTLLHWLREIGRGASSRLADLARPVAERDEPLFSPDPAVEIRWRQVAGAMLALVALDEASGDTRNALALTLQLAREDGFADQVQALGDYLAAQAENFDTAPLHEQVTAWRQALEAPGRIQHASLWSVPAFTPRDDVARLWDGLESVTDVEPTPERSREVLWLGRRIAVDAAGDRGAAAWFVREMMPRLDPASGQELVRDVSDRLQADPRVSDAIAESARDFRVAALQALFNGGEAEPQWTCHTLPTFAVERLSLSDLVAPNGEDAWNDRVLARTLGILEMGYGPYVASAGLDPRTTGAWRTTVAAVPWPRLERLFAAISRHAEAFPLGLRLRLEDYLQALREQSRQAWAGIELGRQVDAVCGPVAPDVAQPLARTLNVLADSLQSLPAPLACLRLYRHMLTERDVTAHAEAWTRALEGVGEAESILDPAVLRLLRPWLRDLIAATPVLLQAITVSTSLTSTHAVFPTRPHAVWRDFVRNALALVVMRQSAPQFVERAAFAIAAATRIGGSETVEAAVPRLQGRLREWFLDLDLRSLFEEIDGLRRMLRSLDRFESLRREVSDIARRAEERLPVLAPLGGAGLLLSLARRTVEPVVATRFGLPAAAFLGGAETLEYFAALGDAEQQRLTAALRNTLSGHVEDPRALDAVLESMHAAATRWKALATAWDDPFGLRPGEDDDLRRVARRVAVEAWRERSSVDALLAWYGYDLLPSLERRPIERPLRSMLDRMASSRSFGWEPLVRDFAARFGALQRNGKGVDEVLAGTDAERRRGLWGRLSSLVGGR